MALGIRHRVFKRGTSLRDDLVLTAIADSVPKAGKTAARN